MAAKRKRKLPPSHPVHGRRAPWGNRKAGASRSRLLYSAAPSQEIVQRQREARRPKPVTVRYVDPAELRAQATKGKR